MSDERRRSTEQHDDDQRGPEPGRRDDDLERARVLGYVDERVRELRWRWLALWVATLAFSALAWNRASAPAESARHDAQRAKAAAIASERSAAEAKAAADRADRRAMLAQNQARAACQRTRRYGPALARAYAKYHILTPANLADYRATIPTRC